MKDNLSTSLFWKLLERFGVSGIQFILQLVLARLLDPEHYGVLATMIVFTSFANIFIQAGFNVALIQNKDVTEEDYSSVFWLSLSIAVALYLIIFFAAPFIAIFYETPSIVAPLRILALILIPGAFNSIQIAKVSREMDFHKIFVSNIISVIISGIASVIVAFFGGGLWALVIQNLLNTTLICLVMLVTVKWRPQFIFNTKRIAILFNFGWKLLVSNLLNTLDENIQSVIVGKKYSSNTLGYYTRGTQFPLFINTAIVDAVQSVLLPAMSMKQDQQSELKDLTKTSICISSYIIFPMMAGLASISEPLICLLLSDKWLPSVPYMQITCFIFAFYTIHICNLQVINALGRSDLFLKLEILKKCFELPMIIGAVVLFDSPIAIAMTGIVGTLISWFINAYPNKKLIHYSFCEQVIDTLPLFLITFLMYVCVFLIGVGSKILMFSAFVTMLVQIFTGISVYLILSMLLKPYPYCMIVSQLKRTIQSHRHF